MAENKQTYLEQKLDAQIIYKQQAVEFIFQRAKLKMDDLEEIELLKMIDTEIKKEITLNDDRLIIHYEIPESYNFFNVIDDKSKRTKLQFAHNIIYQTMDHSLARVNICVCPENVVFNEGLKPFFLHYGVTESLPPYQVEDETLLLETKATVATLLDNQYDFTTYFTHYETEELSSLTSSIMHAASYNELLMLINQEIAANDKYEQTVIHIPRTKWKTYRYLIMGLITAIIPLLIYSLFVLFFKLPEKDAYIDGNYYFENDEYSSVVETLNQYSPENMPKIVQYQLALSYLVNESLTETQRQNIENTLTLQSDPNYFLYWINIGRGENQEAIDTARILEDRDLIIYGLLKEREQIKADQSLTGQEREETIKQIQEEIDEYQSELENFEAIDEEVVEPDNSENEAQDIPEEETEEVEENEE